MGEEPGLGSEAHGPSPLLKVLNPQAVSPESPKPETQKLGQVNLCRSAVNHFCQEIYTLQTLLFQAKIG